MYELTYLHDHRVFLRREALAAGYDDRDLRAMMRAGVLVRIRHGAYTAAEVWEEADPAERHRLRCHAVLASHGDEVVLSHTSAVLMHGFDVWGVDLDRVHLTRRDRRASRVCDDVRYHRGQLDEHDVVPIAAGGAMTSAARSCIDHARHSSVEAGLVTFDSYLFRVGASAFADLRATHVAQYGWPGSRRLLVTLRLSRAGAQSVGESRLRFLCWEYHVPEPELQVEIRDSQGNLVGTTDFGWLDRGVLGEFDGRVKYVRFLRPGETASDAVFREKVREDRIREHSKCVMIRFTWPDLNTRAQTADRLRKTLKIS